jgi:hypothetical protein
MAFLYSRPALSIFFGCNMQLRDRQQILIKEEDGDLQNVKA